LQASVVDVHSGKIIEGEGGRKVLIHSSNSVQMKPTAKVRSKLVGSEEGKEAVASSSGIDDPSKAARKSSDAGGSGAEIADGQHESRKVAVGQDILDNNAVNLLMAAAISLGSMIVACAVWEVPFSSIVSV
jgi:hypothetical protein